MPTHHRALSALATTALLSSGLALGTAAPAQAAPAEPTPLVRAQSADGLGDLIDVLVRPVLDTLGQAPGVGVPITLARPVIDDVLGLLTFDVTWLCNGEPIKNVPIPNPWEFIPGPAQEGCKITAEVVVKLLSILNIPLGQITTATSNLVEIPLSNIPGLPGDAKAPVPTKAATIGGTPKVGGTLTATAPTWDDKATDVRTTYQWLRAGTVVATGESYVLTPADLGKSIVLLATGTRDKAPGTGSSESAPVVVLEGDAPTATVAPVIEGTASVGESLRVKDPTWSGTGSAENTYEWLRDGQVVANATSATYQLTEADAGKAITVRVTGKRLGYKPGTATSAPLTVSAGEKPLTPSVAPWITGIAEVGSTLAVSTGTWSSPDAEFTYVWRRDGITIPGATQPTYVVQVDDIGSRLSVDVLATATGFAAGRASASLAGLVDRLTSTTGVALPKKQVKKGTRAKLRITLRSAGVAHTGRVRIHDGKRVLKTLSIPGKRTVKLPKLSVGKHRIKVTYVGSRTTAPSTSKVVVLKVVKKNKK